uniref:Choline/carnitine acyltransferase domain-containing protein n=1 Tax=Tetranychus urticae TaxID=32264 RepID=T1KDF2_TETUR
MLIVFVIRSGRDLTIPFTTCRRFFSDDYNYLEKSSLATNFFEKSLPSLPIPKLEETCQRYLEALEPLIEEKDKYESTVKLVNTFKTGIGQTLHKELVHNDKLNRHTSYISEPWFDMYLSARTPLPINYNPFMAWKPDPTDEQNDPLIRASNMIISALRFRRSLTENVLAPEIYHMNPKKSDTDWYRKVMKMSPSRYSWYASLLFKAFPLDMSQYQSLFASTRIPCKTKDRLQKYPDSKHIVLLKKGCYYTFQVLDDSGNLKSPEEIYSAINYVWNVPDDYDKHSIGILTTLERDRWAGCREMINKNPVDAENLNLIDSALFVVCLDDDINTMNDKDPLIEASHNFLHGNARSSVERRPINRWFDKSFSLIFTQDKQCSINFEHSWGDGVAVLRLFNDVYTDSSKNKFVNPSTKLQPNVQSQVKKLNFVLDNHIKSEIDAARDTYNSITSNLDLNYCIYSRMSRNYFKKNKLSPDSMFQLAFQMAYYKISDGKTPTTYEAASTAGFKHGRTETVRSATNQTKKACKLIHSSTTKHSNDELIQALTDCSKKHSELNKNAAMGKGFDRHLFALKYLANKNKISTPEIFTDQNYIHANHFTLSTSSLYGEYFVGGGFGPVVDDGYGLGYGYTNQNLGVFCSSYKAHSKGAQLVEAIVASLDQIGDILEK